MDDMAPVTFVHDDDAVLWAVARTDSADGWLLVRTDPDGPMVEEFDTFVCSKGDWRLSGHPGWPLTGSGQDVATWQLHLPTDRRAWTIQIEGLHRRLDPPTIEVPRDAIEALSWRLAAELGRRHPGRLWIAHTIPIDGVGYDCLTLWRPGDRGQIGPPIFQLNRGGTIQIHHRHDGQAVDHPPRWTWADYLTADPYRFVRTLESAAGLPTPDTVPATTATTLTWRLVATLLAHAVRSVHRIEAVSGFADGAGWGHPNDELFASFPGARRALDHPDATDPLGTPHRRYWFVCVDGEPRVALSTHGTAWLLGNVEIDLMAEYEAADRRLGPIAAHLVQDVID